LDGSHGWVAAARPGAGRLGVRRRCTMSRVVVGAGGERAERPAELPCHVAGVTAAQTRSDPHMVDKQVRKHMTYIHVPYTNIHTF
jgi:hypothetical protein